MQRKLLSTGLCIIVLHLPHMSHGNFSVLNQKLKELEIGLVTLRKQTEKLATPEPSRPQKPSAPEPSPQAKKPSAPGPSRPQKPSAPAKPRPAQPKKRRGAGSQPSGTTRPTPAPTVEVPQSELGKQILEFTNQFRAQNNKPPLAWNQTLADLSTEHSQNMASGRVPFGHDGFQNRAARARFRSAAENVYMTSSPKNLAKSAVDGWINSAGHRKNLLGDYRYCGIGAYKSSQGYWYFTQMFGS